MMNIPLGLQIFGALFLAAILACSDSDASDLLYHEVHKQWLITITDDGTVSSGTPTIDGRNSEAWIVFQRIMPRCSEYIVSFRFPAYQSADLLSGGQGVVVPFALQIDNYPVILGDSYLQLMHLPNGPYLQYRLLLDRLPASLQNEFPVMLQRGHRMTLTITMGTRDTEIKAAFSLAGSYRALGMQQDLCIGATEMLRTEHLRRQNITPVIQEDLRL